MKENTILATDKEKLLIIIKESERIKAKWLDKWFESQRLYSKNWVVLRKYMATIIK
jgi:hypothetical protein